MAELHIEMVNPQGTILDTISDRAFTRDSVVLDYAWCIRQREQVDFRVINRAILDRWSPSGLEYIKRKAWAMFEVAGDNKGG